MPGKTIRCQRIRGPRGSGRHRIHVNVPRALVQHSPDGFEWGYAGSGPADLALNILHLFLPPGCDGQQAVALWRGECSGSAWDLHQSFKLHFLTCLPDTGGTITREAIEHWLDARGCPYWRQPAPAGE